MKIKIKVIDVALILLFSIIFVCLFGLFTKVSYAETFNVRCANTLNKNSQVIYSLAVFYDRGEAVIFARQYDGDIIKEQGQELYYVFPKNALKYCQNFVWLTTK